VFADLTDAGRKQVDRDGMAPASVDFNFLADLRYVGQEHTISIPVRDPGMLGGHDEELRRLFDTEHHQRYGQAAPDERLEVVNIRLVVTAGRADSLAQQWLSEQWVAEAPVAHVSRDVIFADASRPVRARVVWRPSLAAGARIDGPAVIEEPNATTLLHPGDVAVVSDAGHLVIDVALASAGTP
jgi:N-methylhydantoinase A